MRLFLFSIFLLFSVSAKADLPDSPTKEECVRFYDEKMALKEEAEKNHEENEKIIAKLEAEGKTDEAYQIGFKSFYPLLEIAHQSEHCVEFDERYREIQINFCTGYLMGNDRLRKFFDLIKWSFPFCEMLVDQGNQRIFVSYLTYYLRGNSEGKNYAAAIEFIDSFVSKHPDKNDVSFFKVPIYMRGGYGVEKDEKKAFEIARSFLETEPMQAGSACQLSLFYKDGIGTEKDIQKAEELLAIYKAKMPNGECSRSAYDFMFEASPLEKEILNNKE